MDLEILSNNKEAIKVGKGQTELSQIKETLEKISKSEKEEDAELVNISSEKLDAVVKQMISVINVLEGQLKDSIEMNTALKNEARAAAREIAALKKDKLDLQNKLHQIERTATLAEDLEKKFEMVVEELEKYKGICKSESAKVQLLNDEISDLSRALNRATEERDDAYREIVVLADNSSATGNKPTTGNKADGK